MTQMAQRIETALHAAAVAADRMRTAAVTDVIQVALAVAEYVTGTEHISDPTVIAERIALAMETLDDENVVIAVNPADWDAVAANVQLPPDATIERDPTLQTGEARLRGTWSSIDMTREAALGVAREVLS